MKLSEEVALQEEAKKFGVEYDSKDPEGTKTMINITKNSWDTLLVIARKVGVSESVIQNCNGNIPCLIKAIEQRNLEIAKKKTDEEIEEEQSPTLGMRI